MSVKIKKVLMERDGLSEQEALDLIKEAREVFNSYVSENDYESAENICQEFFGLEPDYLFGFVM